MRVLSARAVAGGMSALLVASLLMVGTALAKLPTLAGKPGGVVYLDATARPAWLVHLTFKRVDNQVEPELGVAPCVPNANPAEVPILKVKRGRISYSGVTYQLDRLRPVLDPMPREHVTVKASVSKHAIVGTVRQWGVHCDSGTVHFRATR